MKKIYLLVLLSACCATIFSQSPDEMECIPPDGIYAVNITLNSADITWSAGLPPAIEYIVNYRALDDTIWYAVSVFDDSIASVYALDTCQGYEFNVTAICDLTNEATSVSDTFYTKCDTGVTGLHELLFDPDLLIYPNPAHGIINVDFNEPVYGDVFIFVRNGSGVLLYKTQLFLNGETSIQQLNIGGNNKSMNYITVFYNAKMITSEIFLTDL